MSDGSLSQDVFTDESDTEMDLTDISTPAMRSDLSNISEFMDHLAVNDDPHHE